MARSQRIVQQLARAGTLIEARRAAARPVRRGLARRHLREASFYITVGASLRLLLLAPDLDTSSCVVAVVLLVLLAPSKRLRRAARAIGALRSARE